MAVQVDLEKEAMGVTHFFVGALFLHDKEIGHWHLVVNLLVSNQLA